jgi:hypothetical protein
VTAKHTKTGRATRWSGTPYDLALLAREAQKVVRSASHANQGCTVRVEYNEDLTSEYDSPEEFVKELDASTIHGIQSVMLVYSEGLASLSATIYLRRADGIQVLASGDDLAIAEGVSKRLADMCGGRRLVVPGIRLRRAGEVSHLDQLRARAGTLSLVVVTAAVTAAITVVVTKLLS